jgi:hypothetical protein
MPYIEERLMIKSDEHSDVSIKTVEDGELVELYQNGAAVLVDRAMLEHALARFNQEFPES